MHHDVKAFDVTNAFNNTNGTVILNGVTCPAYSFCPNVAGYYRVEATTLCWCSGGSCSDVETMFNKNGTNYGYGTFVGGINMGSSQGTTGSDVVYLNGTSDYITAVGYCSGTGTLYFNGSANASYSHFSGSLISK